MCLKNVISVFEFEEVLTCLEDNNKLQEFILKLKIKGKNSEPFLYLQKSMVLLKMNENKRIFLPKNIIQKTLALCDPMDCFQKYRFVCKSWQNAVETLKLNRSFDSNLLNEIIRKSQTCNLPNFSCVFDRIRYQTALGTRTAPTFYKKILKIFRKFSVDFGSTHLRHWGMLGTAIVESMKNLNEINILDSCSYIEEMENVVNIDQLKLFVRQLLQNSNMTVKKLKLFSPLVPNVLCPNVTRLKLQIHGEEIFINQFPQILQNMESLEIVELNPLIPDVNVTFPKLFEFIHKNYAKHCIYASNSYTLQYLNDILNFLPIKIMDSFWDLTCLENKKYNYQVKFFMTRILPSAMPMDWGWGRWKEIFDQCSNLKAISFFNWENKNEGLLDATPECDREIWKERIAYFQSRGIQILCQDDFYQNEKLQRELAKEFGLKWSFMFHPE